MSEQKKIMLISTFWTCYLWMVFSITVQFFSVQAWGWSILAIMLSAFAISMILNPFWPQKFRKN
jgi:hypothetical protein